MASDFTFTGMPNAPGAASYSAPLLQFSPLADLGKSYFEGTQEANTLAKQQLFRNGIPRDPSGNLDLNKITDMVAKTGGYEGVESLITQQMQLQAGDRLANAGTPPQGAPSQGAAQPGATPAPIPAQPNLSATGSDAGDQGAPTIRSMVTELAGGKEATPVISGVVRQLRIHPDAPLNPDQAGQVKQLFAQLPQPPATPGQTKPAGTMEGVLPGDSPAASQALRGQAADIQRLATSYSSLNKPAAEEAQKRAATLTAQADKMDERLSTAAQRPANIADKATEQRNKGQIDASDKTYAGLRGQEIQYQTENGPAIQTAKGILQNPKMYSGIGADTVLDINKIRSAFGGDTEPAALQEALTKVTAINMLSQFNNQRAQLEEQGQQGGRIFAQQVEQIMKASAGLGNTIKGNLFLVNYQDRLGQFQSELASMARDYKATHNGLLGDGFDKQVAERIKAKPIFTPQEQAHPLLLASPDAPASVKDKGAAKAWANSMGLKTGDSIRLPNGNYAQVP